MPGSTGPTLPDAKSPQCTDPAAKIACAFSWAPGLNKPLLVGEAGIKSGDLPRRAAQIKSKAEAAFAAGADGYLVWHLISGPTDGYEVIPGTGDPLFPTLATIAASLKGH